MRGIGNQAGRGLISPDPASPWETGEEMKAMENKVEQYEDRDELLELAYPDEQDPRRDLYLILDWEHEQITVEHMDLRWGTPESVYSGRATLAEIPWDVDATMIRDTVNDLLPEIDRVADQVEITWDGCNWRGNLDDIEGAILDLQDRITRATEAISMEIEVWDPSDWYATEITGITTDEEIAEIARTSEIDARQEGVILDTRSKSVRSSLVELRDYIRDQGA